MKDFDKTICKVKFVAGLFVGGFQSAVTDKAIMGLSAGVGLYQGLKYNGNLSRGIQAGLATALTIGVMNGCGAVMDNWYLVKELNTL